MVEAGIEHTSGSGSGAADGHFKELLSHLLSDEEDHVIGLFRKYELMQYIEDKVVYQVKDSIESRKNDYAPKFAKIFKKYDRSKVGKEIELINEQIAKGVSIKNYYEHVADKHNVKVVHVKEDNKASATLAHMKEGAQGDQKADQWAQAAADLKAESRKSVAAAKETMSDVEARANAGMFSDEEMYEPQEQFDIGDLGIDDAHENDHSHLFEELDLSQPPHFFTILDVGQQGELHKAFEDENN